MKLTHTHDGLELNGLTIKFHRTLRLPEDGNEHNLPPSLGAFPLARVDDYKEKVPASWREHGGLFLPLYQREAMWLSFSGERPRAIKVAAGKVNAVSGTSWTEELQKLTPRMTDDPAQDYMVAPPQPWLDGFNTGGGIIRQFVAMPLGMKYTVEAQVTGEEVFGGLQLIVYKPKTNGPADIALNDGPRLISELSGMISEPSGMHAGGGVYMNAVAASADASGLESSVDTNLYSASLGLRKSTKSSRGAVVQRTSARPRAAEMGLAQGGQMKQAIYADPYGIEAWDTEGTERVFVHIVNSELWREITGEPAPPTPVSAQAYTAHGLPWFDLYDEHVPCVDGSETLKKAKTVGELDKEHGFEGQQDDTPIDESKNVITHQVADKNAVRDGNW